MVGTAHFRRVLWLVSACALLLAPRAEAFSRTLAADFDGDGEIDWVAIDRVEPSIMHIWLSGTGTAEQIHSRRPVLQIAARDVDGDHLPELIAAEENQAQRQDWTKTHLLRVWKQDAHRGFHRYHARPPTPRTIEAHDARTLDRGDPADDCPDGLGGFQHPQHSAVRRGSIAVRPPSGSAARTPHADAALASRLSFDQSSPRAPPVFHLANLLFA
jgi:hypothetical protein